jgi:hypothetical protein
MSAANNSGHFKTGDAHPYWDKTLSEGHKTKLSEAKKGENHPRFGKPRPEGAGSPSLKIEVLDQENN